MDKHIWRSRWIGAVLTIIILGILTRGAFAQSGPQIKLVPNTITVSVGQTLDMTVEVENVTNLYGIEWTLTFNPNLLEVVDANPDKPGVQIATGGFFPPNVEDTNVVENGMITYIVARVEPNPAVSGSGALARITFRATGSGESTIRFDEVTLTDRSGAGIGSDNKSAQIIVLAGSVDGANPTPVQATVAPPTSTPVPPTPTTAPQPAVARPSGYNCASIQGYHIVKRGETLYAIARAYATNPYAIGTCNPTVNPRLIHASNHLAIPYAPWANIPPGPAAERQFGPSLTPAPVPTPAPGCRAWHPVQPQETLTAIGLRYNADLWNIARANRIYNLHLLHTGQVLCIP